MLNIEVDQSRMEVDELTCTTIQIALTQAEEWK